MQKFNLENLLMKNQFFVEEYKCSPLMNLLNNPKIKLPENKNKLLAAIQTLSDYFQKTAFLRYVFTDNFNYLQLAKEHLKEEFGHNDILLAERNNESPTWDPILEATSAWFSWKMLSSNDDEKTVLMHLVLETSGNIFFHQANEILGNNDGKSYFALHSEIDNVHEKMGNKLLSECSDKDFVRLFDIQQKSWDMLNVTCKRIAELVEENSVENIRQNQLSLMEA